MREYILTLYTLSIMLLLVVNIGTLAQTQPRGVETEAPASLQRQGKIYALIVGVSDYQSEMINDLRYAAADARSLAEYLRSAPISQGKIIELYDKQATRSSIYHNGFLKIDALVFDHTIKPEDLIIIYFSGHGGAFTKLDSYFFPHDAAHTTDAGSSFSIRDIKTFIQRWANPEKKLTVMFIFDACRSTTLARGQSEMDLVEVSKYLEVDNNEILMAASQGGEPAQETGELKHGVFSYYLIEGLYGKADDSKDGSVSLGELQQYISTNVYSKTKTVQVPLIKYPALFQRKALVPVNAELLAKVNDKLMLDLSNQNIIAMATKGGSENAKAVQLSELIGKFNARLQEGRLVRPSTDCAYDYYKQMTKVVPAKTLEDYKTQLVVALYDAALGVIKHDLNGERRYLRPKLGNSKQGYDLTYYEDGAQSMKAYSALMQGKTEPVALAMQQYLAGRSLTIQFLETEYKDTKLITAAIGELKKGTKAHPTQAFLWQGLAMAYLDDPSTEYAEAKKAATKAMELAPQWSYPLVTLSDCASGEDLPDLAASYIKKATELNPYDFYAFTTLGDYEKDPLASMRWYKRAYAIDTAATLTNFAMGLGHYNLDHFDSAIVFLNKVINLSPDFKQAYFCLAYSEQAAGRLDEAAVLYKKVIEFYPQDGDAYNNLANTLGDLGRKEEAILLYQKAIQLDSTDGDYFFNLGNTLYDLNRKKEAIAQYQKAIQLDSTDGDYFFSLGNTLYELDRKQEAIARYQNAIQLDSTDGGYFFNLGNTLYDLDRKQEAIAQYQKAIQLDSGGGYFNNLAITLVDLGYRRDALNLFQKAVKLDSTAAWSLYWLADDYRHLGDLTNASRYYQQALRHSVNDSSLIAWCHLRLRNNALAETIFKESLARKSDEANNYDYACFLALTNRPKESIQYLERAFAQGYNDWKELEKDDDLIAIKDLAEYTELVQKYRQR